MARLRDPEFEAKFLNAWRQVIARGGASPAEEEELRRTLRERRSTGRPGRPGKSIAERLVDLIHLKMVDRFLGLLRRWHARVPHHLTDANEIDAFLEAEGFPALAPGERLELQPEPISEPTFHLKGRRGILTLKAEAWPRLRREVATKLSHYRTRERGNVGGMKLRAAMICVAFSGRLRKGYTQDLGFEERRARQLIESLKKGTLSP